MSVIRKVIADVLSLSEEQVRCENCKFSDRWINDAHFCDLWNTRASGRANDFCSFFVMKEKKDDQLDKDRQDCHG